MLESPRQLSALVTGASRGIGKAISIMLAKRGYALGLISRNASSLDALIEEIQKLCPKATALTPFALDVSDQDAVQDAAQQFIHLNSQIDLLVNNAGVYRPGTSNINPKDFERLFEVNLFGSFNMVSSVVPHMKAQRKGQIVNIASRSGKIGFARSGAYSASKFGLVGYGEALCKELSPFGIKVTNVCPSFVATSMAETPRLTIDQMIPVDEIARIVEFLLDLPQAAAIRELVIECQELIHES